MQQTLKLICFVASSLPTDFGCKNESARFSLVQHTLSSQAPPCPLAIVLISLCHLLFAIIWFDKHRVCHHAAPCSPHRSPFCSSLNPADHTRHGLQGGSQSTPNTPKVRPRTYLTYLHNICKNQALMVTSCKILRLKSLLHCLQKERLRRDRRTASPGCGSPVRRSESPASVTKHLGSPTTSK